MLPMQYGLGLGMKNGSIRLRKEVVVEEEEEEEEQEEAQGVLIFLEPGPRSPRKVKEKVEEEESDGDEGWYFIPFFGA